VVADKVVCLTVPAADLGIEVKRQQQVEIDDDTQGLCRLAAERSGRQEPESYEKMEDASHCRCYYCYSSELSLDSEGEVFGLEAAVHDCVAESARIGNEIR